MILMHPVTREEALYVVTHCKFFPISSLDRFMLTNSHMGEPLIITRVIVLGPVCQSYGGPGCQALHRQRRPIKVPMNSPTRQPPEI
jgi:hypothetical protein